MKTKTIKTKTNSGHTVHFKFIYLSGVKEFEPCVIIESKRIIPKKKLRDYSKINDSSPMFSSLRNTDNYSVLFSRSQPIKISTFNSIKDFINECENN